MSLDGQQVSNILDRIMEALPDRDHDKIAEIIYRAVARKIVEDLRPSDSCFPGFRLIKNNQDYDPGYTYFRLIYIDEDRERRYHGIIAMPNDRADELAAHFGSCKCHTE